jgi:hypothetical protein
MDLYCALYLDKQKQQFILTLKYSIPTDAGVKLIWLLYFLMMVEMVCCDGDTVEY